MFNKSISSSFWINGWWKKGKIFNRSEHIYRLLYRPLEKRVVCMLNLLVKSEILLEVLKWNEVTKLPHHFLKHLIYNVPCFEVMVKKNPILTTFLGPLPEEHRKSIFSKKVVLLNPTPVYYRSYSIWFKKCHLNGFTV